jgi:hypothetical protein
MMSPIQRFTRDGASRYIWAAVCLAAIVGLAFATTAGRRALDEERAASKQRAVGYVRDVLDTRLDNAALARLVQDQSSVSLQALVDRSILTDKRVARVRIWWDDGTMLFSTGPNPPLRPGGKAGLNIDILKQASHGAITLSGWSDTGGAKDPERSYFRTYVPLTASDTAIAEIDQTDRGTLAPIRSEWFRYQMLAGTLVLLFLFMLALSLRDPIARINAGVPFPASSIPLGYSVIDDDRLNAVHEVYRLASERIARLQEKIAESEEDRRRLEGVIQRALSKVSSDSDAPAPSEAGASTPQASPSSVVQVPESEIVADAPVDDAWVAAASGALARASREKPLPVTSRKEKSAAKKQVDKTPTAAPQKNTKPAVAPPHVAKPRPAPAPARQEAAAAPSPPPAPAPISPKPEANDSAHAAALGTFIRFTEKDRRSREDTTDLDQGAVRAALARTAGRKKPDVERLQLHEESPGDQPTGTD